MIIFFVILMGVFFLITTSSSMFADTATDEQMRESGVLLSNQDNSVNSDDVDFLLEFDGTLPSNYYSDPDNLVVMSINDSE
ncbi:MULTISPECIES: hypothetical protein [unclassified Pseudoalteromonas]|uniref:hypothetical protein n=1 Tax=unclassified Pseudoalteromonas TaxID=194690 RepID=UPI00160477E6|nr:MULTISPECIES: hypothetical protein [unclassified Pseudoalteromonas]MBB1294955.1 hypothetical protein [Pseudoalteromonas sp. SR41-4]MBB1410884.1 hypothetical protein [Pseudoalteromonas sp. SG44-17]